MPRPHRRRREKKLMTLDEVNSRFPLIKYKAWRLSREQSGLPAAGGITAPPSRAGSIKNVATIDTEHTTDAAASLSEETPAVVISPPKSPEPAHIEPKPDNQGSLPTTTKEERAEKHMSDQSILKPSEAHTNGEDATAEHAELERISSGEGEDDDDDDQIHTAVAPEMLQAPGDTCAICLDTLEDDEDVRGLTCGHAFHASCLDPWLTGRRACCPLCKADYYVPKPRPEGEAVGPTATNGTDASRPRVRMAPGLRAVPVNAQPWTARTFGTRAFFGRSQNTQSGADRYNLSRVSSSAAANASPTTTRQSTSNRRGTSGDTYLALEARRRGVATRTQDDAASAPSNGQETPASSNALTRFFRGRRNEGSAAAASASVPATAAVPAHAPVATPAQPAPETTTPSQLEAGTR
jgi:hypothetical protein